MAYYFCELVKSLVDDFVYMSSCRLRKLITINIIGDAKLAKSTVRHDFLLIINQCAFKIVNLST